MVKQKGITLNCFSPPVMLATLAIEFSLAAYSLWRYRLNSATRLITALLVGLGSFQLAEFYVCTGYAGHVVQWSTLGFVAITALPPLGLHLMHALANKPRRQLVNTAYVTMLGFMTYFLVTPTAFIGHQCTGNYVIFQFSDNVTGLYSVYYFGWILASLGLGMRWLKELQSNKLHKREVIKGLIFGYLIFIIPTAVVDIFFPKSQHGIPSVMCGFAVLLALTLGFYILPRVGKLKATSRLQA